MEDNENENSDEDRPKDVAMEDNESENSDEVSKDFDEEDDEDYVEKGKNKKD